MSLSVLVFDIRTIPDVSGLRAIYALPHELSDREVAEFAFQRRRAAFGVDSLPAHLQRIACISWLAQGDNGIVIDSFCVSEMDESTLLQGFFRLLTEAKADLVSWDGRRFASPALMTRAAIHGVRAGRCMESLHDRHLALAEELSVGEKDSFLALGELTVLSGFPSIAPLGVDGVWAAHMVGDHAAVRADCEQDVVKAWLLHLRRNLVHGVMERAAYERELSVLREALTDTEKPNWNAFLADWPI